ncbi:MAG TPA: MFS transporter [Thermoanaerobaculia bacterium]|nr:MFS transporter [Thermoanaerobaculia bacterium]
MSVAPAPPPLFTRRFLSLWLFQFGTFFSAFQLLPVIPLRIIELGGSKAQAGMFLFVYTIASALAAPVTGTIGDHVGRRRMLIGASMLFVVFSLAYGVVPWLPLVLIIGLVHGAIWSSILSAGSALMTDFIPVERRTQGLAYWGLASTAAIAVAPAAGLFMYRFGWMALCVEIAAISAAMAIWASRLPASDRRDPNAQFPRLGDLWDWRVAYATLSLAVIAFGYGGVTSYVALLSRERGITPESLFFTVFALTVILVRVFTSHLGDRYGHKVLLYPAYAAMPLAFLTLAVAQTRLHLSGSAILFGIGMGASFPSFTTFIVAHTDEKRRGRTFGSIIWAFDTGIGIGSMVIGAMTQRRGFGFAFNVAAAISCLAIPLFMSAARQLTRGTRVAENAEHAGTG